MTLLQSSHVLGISLVLLAIHFIFQTLFDPLRKIPGPFWAKRTHLWKAFHMYSRDLPQAILKAHQKYGPVIRIGPNDVNFQGRDAIDSIYKAGRSMPKTIFYDAFTAIHPNLFSTRDEEVHVIILLLIVEANSSTQFHSVRRRQMAHSFSMATLLKFEPTFDKHLNRLFANIERSSSSGQVFDIKDFLACYAYDVIGELAFEKDFDTQSHPSKDTLPPIPDHILIGTLYGLVPSLMPYSMRLGNKLPIPGLQKLFESRRRLSEQTAEYVRAAIEKHKEGDRESLLANVLEARNPETGARLTTEEICAEAFAFL